MCTYKIGEYDVHVDCGTVGGVQTALWLWLENLKIGGHFRNVGVAGRMTLNKLLMRL
jgi:hypothetical protein